MVTRYFKAILEAVSPSHSKGKKRTVFGMTIENQDMYERAMHIGEVQGLGANKVISLHEYKSGEEWYKAQYGKGGKGWHESPGADGKAPIHKEVAERAQAKHAQNTPMRKTPIYKPPYRVDVWEERDRLIITVYDKNNKEVASWVDDDARQMFEDGFFDSKDLKQSVFEYLKDIKIIKGG